MLESRDQKIKAILASQTTASHAKDRARAHYLEARRTPWLDPQRFFQRYPKVYHAITALLAPRLPFSAWRKHFPDFKSSIVLNLGCGTQNLDPEIINVDFTSFPHVDILLDFTKTLPIRNESVDGVISISVLEHLVNPSLAANEIVRILKKGGVVYVNTPFLYPYHGAPEDYSRWTLSGLSQIFGKNMQVLSSGPRGGVFCVYISVTAHLLAQCLCCGSEKLYYLFNHMTLAFLAPFKLFDFLNIKLPFSHYLSPSFYWIAKKIK
jgi:SAM-dependent methyltransferase